MPAEKSKNGFEFEMLDDVLTHIVFYFTKSGLNRVAMARHGLILWENEATGLKIIF